MVVVLCYRTWWKHTNCIGKGSPMDYTCIMSPLQRQNRGFNICICQQQLFLVVCDNQSSNFHHWFYDALDVFDWWIIIFNDQHRQHLNGEKPSRSSRWFLHVQEQIWDNKKKSIWAGPRTEYSRFNCPM